MKILLAETIAIGSSGGLVHGVFMVFIFALCLALVWWLGDYVFKKMGVPAIVLTVWQVFFLIIGVVLVINFLMGLGGHSFIAW